MTTYSHSKLSTFETCPLQYKFHYKDRMKMEADAESIETFVGSRVHESLEELYRLAQNCRILSVHELLADYDRRWAKSWSDDVEIHDEKLSARNFKDVGRDCLAKYYGRHHPFSSGIVLGLEKPISQRLDDTHNLTGFIDRLMEAADGVYEVHDYKTSKHLPSQADVDADRQLGLYEIAVRHEFPDAKEVRLIWHYLRFDKRLVSVRTKKQRERLLADTLGLIARIETTREFRARESNLCDYCSYCEICPAKGHRARTEGLSPNRFLAEPGVRLVNRWDKLRATLRKRTEEINAEIEEVKDALLAYAKKRKLEVVVGSACEARVKHEAKVSYPGKHAEGREELEAIIRKAGKWKDVSELDVHRLKSLVADEALPEPLLKSVRKFETREQCTTVSLAKRKDAEDD